MALLLLLLTALVPCLLGMGTLRVFYGGRTAQEMSLADGVLTGGIICIGLAETSHLGAVMMGWSFSCCIKVFYIGVAVLCVASILELIWSLRKYSGIGLIFERGTSRARILWILFAAVAVMQLIYVSTMQKVSIAGDMTLETVNSFLESDRVYEINPLTGKAYTLGMPLRLKILCLPTLYGILCQSFRINSEQLVYGISPMIVLLGSFFAYSTLAKYFFPKDLVKRGMFMLLVAVLFAMGDYMLGMDGFGVMHSGFRGVTIRAVILLPYTVGLVLRRKYRLIVLCVLAEACMVWTLYGIGACAFVAVGMLSLRFIIQWYTKRMGREEDAICRNS